MVHTMYLADREALRLDVLENVSGLNLLGDSLNNDAQMALFFKSVSVEANISLSEVYREAAAVVRYRTALDLDLGGTCSGEIHLLRDHPG